MEKKFQTEHDFIDVFLNGSFHGDDFYASYRKRLKSVFLCACGRGHTKLCAKSKSGLEMPRACVCPCVLTSSADVCTVHFADRAD